MVPKLRVARPSDDLEALIRFYHDGLGLDVLYRFEEHDGFDGVMLGNPDAPYHFEFTRSAGHVAGRAPTSDNLLVFYIPDSREWGIAAVRCSRQASLRYPHSIHTGTGAAGRSKMRTATGSSSSKMNGISDQGQPGRHTASRGPRLIREFEKGLAPGQPVPGLKG